MLKRFIKIYKAKIRNVKQNLGKFENNFKQLERKICDFDFKNEMSHVLRSNQVIEQLFFNFFSIHIKTIEIILELEQ
jgi:hypothetical protein